jgi:hypothetical protein
VVGIFTVFSVDQARAATTRVSFRFKGLIALQMPIRFRHLAAAALALLTSSLGGCGTINEKITEGAGDYIPQWLGGLPADAPPRPGSPKYDEFMRERERKRLEPAPAKSDPGPTQQSPSAGLSVVH